LAASREGRRSAAPLTSHAALDVQVFALVPNTALPVEAPASTRTAVPPGYGVQEQCLPFTAATALGLLIRSPIDFGFCERADIPAGTRAFQAPQDALARDEARMFYVRDNPACRFVGNAFALDPLPVADAAGMPTALNAIQPGLSFFDRPDQRALFKVHLPFILRTPATFDTLFAPAINRDAPLEVLAGLVETDWYAHPVNLVARRPDSGAVHVRVGAVLAQAVFIARDARRARVRAISGTADEARLFRRDLLEWYRSHAADRSAYKRLARSRDGRV
jgi:hypothetical protein